MRVSDPIVFYAGARPGGVVPGPCLSQKEARIVPANDEFPRAVRIAAQRLARRRLTFPSSSKEIARVFHMPKARWSAPDPLLCAGEPCSRREEAARQLEKWEAPALSNELVETLAAIFLRRPEHKLVPFFVWLEKQLRR